MTPLVQSFASVKNGDICINYPKYINRSREKNMLT